MAPLPEKTTTLVVDLQLRLLAIIDRATTTGFVILEQYGETEATITDIEQLQNVRERAETYYSRFYTLLLRIAESYPIAPAAMLDLLYRSIQEAQATSQASEATIQETKKDWNIL